MVLRELFIKLGLDTDSQSFAKGILAADGVEAVLRGVVNVAREAVVGFAELVKKTAEGARGLTESAQATGLSTQALQQLRAAARESGVQAERFETGIFRLSRSLMAASKGSNDQSKAFAKLGVHARDASGKLRSTDDVFMDVAESISKMPDGLEKTAMSMEVFGRAGARMIPLLNKGKAGISELREEAFTLSDESLAAGKDLALAIESVSRNAQNLWKSAIAPLLPAIDKLVRRFLAWQKENGKIMKQRIEKYIGYVITAVNKLGDAFEWLTENSELITVVLMSLAATFAIVNAAAIAAAVATIAAWAIAAAPFVALGAAIAYVGLLLNSFYRYTQKKDSVVGDWIKSLEDWLYTPKDDEPFFVTAMRTFILFIRDSIKLANELGAKLETVGNFIKNIPPVLLARLVVKAAVRTGEETGDLAGRIRVADQNRRYSQPEWSHLLSPEKFQEMQSAMHPIASMPEYSPPANTAMSIVNSPATINMSVHAAPGMSEERVARIAVDKIEEAQSSAHEEALQSLGP